jgi:hypothetical protein
MIVAEEGLKDERLLTLSMFVSDCFPEQLHSGPKIADCDLRNKWTYQCAPTLACAPTLLDPYWRWGDECGEGR